MRNAKRLGILTGGGDCPGLNAVLRAVVKAAGAEGGCEVVGIERGFEGLVRGESRPLGHEEVRGILARGGTLLGTSSDADPFRWREELGGETDLSRRAAENARALALDALVVVGGDETLAIARRLDETLGVAVIGIPKTIHGDIMGTDATVGFDTARGLCAEAADRLGTTAEAHDRVMVLEVMGRSSGFLALHAGLAGGADAILLPEIPWDPGTLAVSIARRRRRGRTHGLVVVAEGASPLGTSLPAQPPRVPGRGEVRRGGAGQVAAEAIAAALPLEVRLTTLGHLQRGGTPSAGDRMLAIRFGVAAARLGVAGARNRMVALRAGRIVDVPLSEASGRRRVDPAGELIQAARSLGTSFGDAAEAAP